MTPEEICELYEFNDWANQRVLGACSALNDEQFTLDFVSSYRSVRDTLVHIMGGEWIWLELWLGRSPTRNALPRAEEFPNFESVRGRWEQVGGELLAFSRTVTPADLEHVIEYRNPLGNTFAYSLRRMMQHVVNHSTYHRGQLITLLRQLGAKTRATDYLRYFDWLAGQPEE